MMGSELAMHEYNCALEDICEEEDCEYDEAEKILEARLDKDPRYLNGYLAGDEDMFRDC